MAKQVSKTIIGGFIVSAMTLLVVGVVLFGGGKFLEKKYQFVLFFDESVKGLSVGAPVVFRGVEVGSVEKVLISADPQSKIVSIPVIININSESVQFKNKDVALKRNLNKAMPNLIDRGLRAQLALESFVTGQLMIALDFHPDKPASLVGKDEKYMEIPTIPTAKEQLAQMLNKVSIKEIFEKLVSTIENIKMILTSPELMGTVRSFSLAIANANKLIAHTDQVVGSIDKLMLNINDEVIQLSRSFQGAAHVAQKLMQNVNTQVEPLSESLQAATHDVQTLLKNIDHQVQPLSQSFQDTSDDARDLLHNIDGQVQPVSNKLIGALEELEKTLATYKDIAGERSELRYRLNTSLGEISAAAGSLRVLTDYLAQHPDSLLRGKGKTGGE